MNREAKLLWGGFAAAVIGSIQVVSIIIRVASAAGSLTVIHGLQLIFCGSLLVTGILTLYNVWRDHSDGTSDERLLPRSGDRYCVRMSRAPTSSSMAGLPVWVTCV